MKFKPVLFFSVFFLAFSNFTFGQDYQEMNRKCSEILKDLPIGDSIFWVRLEERNECLIGIKAPNFKAITLKKISINSDSLRGKVLVLNFWFTRCIPCINEIPKLNKLVSDYNQKRHYVFFIC